MFSFPRLTTGSGSGDFTSGGRKGPAQCLHNAFAFGMLDMLASERARERSVGDAPAINGSFLLSTNARNRQLSGGERDIREMTKSSGIDWPF